jgi:hypothetical protein
VPLVAWPVVGWAALYFGVVGGSFVKFPRYLLPLTPLLLIFGSGLLLEVSRQRPGLRMGLLGLVFGPTVGLALAFGSIYGRTHPWVQASEVLYRRMGEGTTLVIEQWDHTLPVAMDVDGVWHRPREFRKLTVDPFEMGTPAGRRALAEALAAAEWVVLASPRNWGPLSRPTTISPGMARFYHQLFEGEMGFEIEGIWRVEPQLGPVSLASNPFATVGLPTPAAWYAAAPTRWTLDFGPADESLTVYDHPLPILLRKRQSLTVEILLARLELEAVNE